LGGVTLTTTGALDVDGAVTTVDGTSVSIDGTLASNFTVTGAAQSLTLAVAGGGAQQVLVQSAGTGADAIKLNVTDAAGGIDVNFGLGSLDIDSANGANDTASGAITMNTGTGGAAVAGAGGAGGAIGITAGAGGAGTGVLPGGTGGIITLTSGATGADGGAGTGGAGIISIQGTGGLSLNTTADQTITIGAGALTQEAAGGLITFTGDLSAQGSVDLGDAGTDTISMNGKVDTNLVFVKEIARTIKISDSTTAATAGAVLTVQGGAGTPGAANNGGNLVLDGGLAGVGGVNGSVLIGNANTAGVTITPATTITGILSLGSNLSLQSPGGAKTISLADMAAGATNSLTVAGQTAMDGAGQNGGNLVLNAGNASGASTDGLVQIGLANTSAVAITPNTTIAGTLGVTGAITGNVTGTVSGNAGTVTNGVYTTDTGSVTSTMILNNTVAAGDLANDTLNFDQLSDTLNLDASTTINNTAGAFSLTIGDNLGAVSINSNDWDITAAGDMTGIGAITMDGTLTSSAAIDFNGSVDLGDNGDAVVINSNDWDVSATGDMSNMGSIASTVGDLTLADGAMAAATETVASVAGPTAIDSNTIHLTGALTVTTITGGVNGQLLTIIFDGAAVLTDDDANGANATNVVGSGNLTGADDTVVLLVFDGTSWYQVAPVSTNN
jgi:hypothetical protein